LIASLRTQLMGDPKVRQSIWDELDLHKVALLLLLLCSAPRQRMFHPRVRTRTTPLAGVHATA
jgi:hypothetical protein